MTIRNVGDGVIAGLSTDTKPTAQKGYLFRETDTGDILVSDGTHWWLQGPPGALSNRKWGAYGFGVGAITHHLGLLSIFDNAGTTTPGLDNPLGRRLECVTGAVAGDSGGIRVATSLLQALVDAQLRIRLKLVSTTNMRLYAGLMSNAEPTGDDPLNAKNGMMLGFRSTDTNFQWVRNDVTGTTNFTDTAVAKDTVLRDIRIVATGGGTKYSVSLDGGVSYTDFTTEIPNASNALTLCIQIETSEAVVKTFEIYSCFIQTEK